MGARQIVSLYCTDFSNLLAEEKEFYSKLYVETAQKVKLKRKLVALYQ